jgi:hypothetical protein
MSGSAAALARTIAAGAGPDARPHEDQVRAVEELVEHRGSALRRFTSSADGLGEAVPPT